MSLAFGYRYLFGSGLGITTIEHLDTAFGIDEGRLSRIEGMAVRACIDVHLFDRGTGLEHVQNLVLNYCLPLK